MKEITMIKKALLVIALCLPLFSCFKPKQPDQHVVTPVIPNETKTPVPSILPISADFPYKTVKKEKGVVHITIEDIKKIPPPETFFNDNDLYLVRLTVQGEANNPNTKDEDSTFGQFWYYLYSSEYKGYASVKKELEQETAQNINLKRLSEIDITSTTPQQTFSLFPVERGTTPDRFTFTYLNKQKPENITLSLTTGEIVE